MQNLFDAHAEGLGMLQAEYVSGVPANPPNAQQPGTITYAGKVIPALIGIFEEMQTLATGGLQQSLDAFVYVNKSDMLAAGFDPACRPFNAGENLDVTQPGSYTRKCSVQFANDKYSFWVVTVSARSQNA